MAGCGRGWSKGRAYARMTPTAATTHDLAGRVRVVVVVVDMRFMQQVVSRAHGRCKRAGHVLGLPDQATLRRPRDIMAWTMPPDQTSPSAFIMPDDIRIERCARIELARQRIWNAGLLVNDEATSHIMDMVRPGSNHDEGPAIAAVWLAVDKATGKDVGTAVVSANPWIDGPSPVLNLYVDADHQGRGIGSALVQQVLAAFPHIHANYTADSVHIYQKAGLPPANVPISWEECLSPEQRVSKFIESVCAERAEFDQLQASYRPVLFRPG